MYVFVCTHFRFLLFGQVPTNVNRHDVDEWEHKHPDQVDKVPVEAANLDVFMFQLINSGGNYTEIERTCSDVKHVESRNRKEGGAKQRRRWSAIGERKYFHPVLRQEERPESFMNQVIPLDQVENDKREAEEDGCKNPFPRSCFVTSTRRRNSKHHRQAR